jgi:RND family efflux transporter MFP subunit
MKKTTIYLSALIMLASCGAKKANTDPALAEKQTELETLKKDRAELDKKIKTLEAEIAALDTAAKEPLGELVEIAELTYAPFVSYIDLQAKVDASENVTVTPQMPGVIEKVYVTEGQAVSRGQLLAELDNDAMIKNLETLETQLGFAKDVYNKQKALWDQKIGSEIQYLSAKNNVEMLEKSLAAAKEQLDMTKMVSPISGVIDAVDVKTGQIGSPGFAGIRVVNSSSLKVKGEVSEAYSAHVQTGDNVKLSFPDLNKEVDSRVSFVSKVINPISRTFTAEAKIASEGIYKPNMIAIMKIADYENAKAIAVDVNLVQQAQDGSYVYVVTDNGGKMIASRKEVTVGKIYNGIAEIKSGLAAGDKIITVGYQDIVEGQEVRW